MSLELQAPSLSYGFSGGAVLDCRSQTSDNSPPAKAKEKPYLGYCDARQPNGRHIQVDLTKGDWIHPQVGDCRVLVEAHTDTIFFHLRYRFTRPFEAAALEKLLSQQTSATTSGTQSKIKRSVKSKPSGH